MSIGASLLGGAISAGTGILVAAFTIRKMDNSAETDRIRRERNRMLSMKHLCNKLGNELEEIGAELRKTQTFTNETLNGVLALAELLKEYYVQLSELTETDVRFDHAILNAILSSKELERFQEIDIASESTPDRNKTFRDVLISLETLAESLHTVKYCIRDDGKLTDG